LRSKPLIEEEFAMTSFFEGKAKRAKPLPPKPRKPLPYRKGVVDHKEERVRIPKTSGVRHRPKARAGQTPYFLQYGRP
jgi:hypothetical protein